MYLCSGAIGGIDLLRAAAWLGPLERVRIVTTKKAANLVQSWMPAAQARRLRTAAEPIEVMRGPAAGVTAAFPASTNVAAAVALAVGSWEAVEAVVVADPAAQRTSHVISAEGAAGSYRFEIRNRPAERTPTSSQVVPYAVLRTVADLAVPGGRFR